ncbi:MAG: hypothetical protein ACTSYD_12065 [Candidatus Heimdallarchaeaceae archaeon]
MSSLDSVPSHIVAQRKKFEIMGATLNRGESLRSWFKALLIVSLIFGIPTIPLLADVLKDQIIYIYQALIFGFRFLLLVFLFHWTSKITSYITGAKNDFELKLRAIGYQNKATNTKDEIRLARYNFIYRFMQFLISLDIILGLFMLSGRTNYGYIVGQMVIYGIVIVLLLTTIKFWFTKGSPDSPRMGGKVLVQMFIPTMFAFCVELMLDFFFVASEPNFHHNVLQLGWGLVYPFAFLFILIAVQITTKKTKRERLKLEQAWLAEYQKKQRFIHERNFFVRMFVIFQSYWHQFLSLFRKIPEKTEKDLDKKPSEALVKSIWISLFVTIIPIGFLVPWIMFPYDGIMLVIALITAYVYSMTKYERYKLDVLTEVEQTLTETTEIRTIQFSNKIFYSVSIPTLVFIFAQLVFNGILTKGLYDEYKMMVIRGFTWIALLASIPISIQMVYLITKATDENREKGNLKLFVSINLLFLGITSLVLIGTIISYLVALKLDIAFVILKSVWMYILLMWTTNILPLLYLVIVPKLNEQRYKIAKIGYIILMVLTDLGILLWFLFDILITHFVL